MVYFLAAFLVVTILIIVEKQIEIRKWKNSRNLWFEIACDFARDLEKEHKKVEQMHEDHLEENRF